MTVAGFVGLMIALDEKEPVTVGDVLVVDVTETYVVAELDCKGEVEVVP